MYLSSCTVRGSTSEVQLTLLSGRVLGSWKEETVGELFGCCWWSVGQAPALGRTGGEGGREDKIEGKGEGGGKIIVIISL